MTKTPEQWLEEAAPEKQGGTLKLTQSNLFGNGVASSSQGLTISGGATPPGSAPWR